MTLLPLLISENSVVGPRASGFSSGKDSKAGDIGFIVDRAACRQAENKPLEARSSFPTEPRSYKRQGLRMARVIIRFAVSSPTMVSLLGSHLILWPVRMAMSLR